MPNEERDEFYSVIQMPAWLVVSEMDGRALGTTAGEDLDRAADAACSLQDAFDTECKTTANG